VTRRRVLPSRLLDVVAPVVGTLADAVGELGLLLALCAVYAGFTALYRATPLVALAVALCIAAVIAVAVETPARGLGPGGPWWYRAARAVGVGALVLLVTLGVLVARAAVRRAPGPPAVSAQASSSRKPTFSPTW
jgi:uncharacterized membrane protein